MARPVKYNTPEERKAANAVASAKYRESHPKTEERKQVARIHAQEYRKRPGHREKRRLYQNERNAAARLADPIGYRKKKAEETKRRRWLNPIAIANEQKRHVFGISLDEYNRRLAERHRLCALCNRPFDNTMLGRPVLDHDHVTGQLRDFVHSRCNLGIANFEDDPEQCLLAADYLERHKSGRVYENGILQRSDCAGATRAHSYTGI